MTRDTALAIWYRRLDRHCFTVPQSPGNPDDRPAMESSHAAETDVAAVQALTVADHWPTLAGDRRGWSVEAVADRL